MAAWLDAPMRRPTSLAHSIILWACPSRSKSTKSEGLERRLAVSVPLTDVKSAEDKAATRYATQVRMPGFRPGKAPAAVVRKKFAEAIRQEAIEALVQEAFKTVLERDKLDLATQPHVHDLHFHEGQPLTFELHFEVKPTIALARTSGFRVPRNEKPLTDEMVKEQIETLRDQRAAWTPATGRAQPGDMVTVHARHRRRNRRAARGQGIPHRGRLRPGDRRRSKS